MRSVRRGCPADGSEGRRGRVWAIWWLIGFWLLQAAQVEGCQEHPVSGRCRRVEIGSQDPCGGFERRPTKWAERSSSFVEGCSYVGLGARRRRVVAMRVLRMSEPARCRPRLCAWGVCALGSRGRVRSRLPGSRRSRAGTGVHWSGFSDPDRADRCGRWGRCTDRLGMEVYEVVTVTRSMMQSSTGCSPRRGTEAILSTASIPEVTDPKIV